MNPWRWVDPRTKDVRLSALEEYLRRQGWQRKPCTSRHAQPYEKTPKNGTGAGIFIPDTEQLADYVPSIIYAITNLSEWEDRHPVEVLNDILALTPAADGAAAAKGTKSPR